MTKFCDWVDSYGEEFARLVEVVFFSIGTLVFAYFMLLG